MDDVKKKIAAAIRKAREMAGMNQADAANASGLMPQNLNRAERAGVKTLPTLAKIASAWADKVTLTITFLPGVEIEVRVEGKTAEQ